MRIATREVEETMIVTAIAVIGGDTPDLGVLIDATVITDAMMAEKTTTTPIPGGTETEIDDAHEIETTVVGAEIEMVARSATIPRKRDESWDRDPKRESGNVSKETSKPSTPTPQTAEEQKAARLAKLEQWKKKQAEEQARKQRELEAAGGARSILQEIDRKAGILPAVSSPQSPAAPSSPSPVSTPYAGKFDPKAIVKKAQHASAATKVLGGDIAPPALTNGHAKASQPSPKPAANGFPPKSLKATGTVGKFGLGSKTTADSEVAKKGLDFTDDEGTKKKLEKLPINMALEQDTSVDDAQPDGADDGDNDVDMQEEDGEEEAMAAARAAAEQRSQAERGEDTTMADVSALLPTTATNEEEEEVDPLDAFMQDLQPVPTANKVLTQKTNSKSRQLEPEALFGDDEVDMTAVDNEHPENILSLASATAKKKKKDIPTVNHAKMQYRPFRRNFYSEPVEMADWTEEDVASLRMELDNIKVRGIDVPKPVQKWAQCGLGVQVLEVIQKLGYEAPTSIQAQAIPAIMSGRDVIGVAKTGSGKTIAFLLPMFRHIKDQPPLEPLDGPIGLILSPTRELATQIHKECKPFLKALGLRAVCAYGGAPIKDQIADLKRGAEIVVCTPGRMIDLLAANSGRVTNLKRVTYVVLDEADRMFDMGFEPQVMKILSNIRPDRQTVLFSATFPRQMEALARKTLTKPVEIVVGGRSVVAPEITQIVEVREDSTKFIRLLELLGKLYEDEKNEDDRVLIFVDRQEAADGLLRDLMKKGYPCMSIHGGKDQIDRDSTIDDFKAGVVPILIATSVAARGLDVKQLKLVVNYDAPNHLEDYVHRAGRTGRAGNTGTAVTFLTEEQDRYAVDIAKALRQSGQPVPEAVQKLVDAFMEKVKAGKEKAGASGFGGKGLERLDQERDAAKARERKTFKTGEEGEEQEEKEDGKDVKVGDDLFAKAASSVKAFEGGASLAGVPKGIDLDGKITVHRTEREPAGGSKPGAGAQNQMDKVAAAVGAINQKLSKAGVMRSGVPIDNKGPDAGAFHATLEINDFPQKARWAVTNRTNVAKILEATGTSITTKGSFYPAGKEPGPGENPKLYILVEGDTEVVVHDAMRELMRLLKEGTMSAADAAERTGGRYSVL
ncbi:pre-mRNA-processing ATP-dependent RNA helicase prp5 [Fonsecaea erecta]|uniref:Pre-mRNA-processing ATP-dependent RNA helicase PRP5 n=1 Tax=Fonsecaea erecta TaxID=1367422 RepID=A0A178ZM85_9EURO|nr:pre-mRNA-processing ATP-dependent RNA helicase prp5 [Fonsecaea erecta]OAP60601.1 pre-mRNA-processing ATP-dependent RNA helicase prp5 [Fonsecaea erecta]